MILTICCIKTIWDYETVKMQIRVSNSSDEWYTPRFIIDSLGRFDLDPCAPSVPLFKTAEIMYNEFGGFNFFEDRHGTISHGSVRQSNRR